MTDIIIYGKGKTGKSLYKMLEKQNIKAVLYDDKTEDIHMSLGVGRELLGAARDAVQEKVWE